MLLLLYFLSLQNRMAASRLPVQNSYWSILISELFPRIVWKALLGPSKTCAAIHLTAVQKAVSAPARVLA